jgi:DNA-binding response OmpR family regulator
VKILVIEDEKELARSIETSLEQKKYTCETANTFELAREKINLYKATIMK